jgi:Tat protein secretion system quality control protein TatD with DNase activity
LLPSESIVSDYTTGAFNMQWLTVEVHCFGETGEQCAQLADQARTALIGLTTGGWVQPIEPDNLQVTARLPERNAGILETDGTHESVERFKFLVMPD